MKRKRAQASTEPTRSSARLRNEEPDSAEDQPEAIEEAIPSFPLLSLPRELRDRVYDFHLSATCETSRLRNWGGIRYLFSDEHNPNETRFDPIARPKRPGFYGHFYEPVFHIRHGPEPKQHFMNQYFVHTQNYEAREHAVPSLTLTGENVVAREAWEYYTQRLMVHVDTLNRFQTWCEETIDHSKYVGLRRLYVMSTGVYRPPPSSTSSLRANTNVTEDERFPTFLLEIVEQGRAIAVSTRFRLCTEQELVLQTNLDTLLKPRLQTKRRLDGEDLIEAMFAMHNMRVQASRHSLAIGPLKKGYCNWTFRVDQDAVDKVSTLDKSPSQMLVEAVHRIKTFGNVLYRGEVTQTL